MGRGKASWASDLRRVSYFVKCLRMVSGARPAAMPCLAICCEYHTSDMLRRCFFKSRYAFCQLSYIARVSSLRASRRALRGV